MTKNQKKYLIKCKEKAEFFVSQLTIQEMISQLLYNAPAIPRLNLPSYNWWNEGLHGAARSGTSTVFPQAIGLAATFDKKLLQKVAEITSTEQRAKFLAYSSHNDRDIYKGLSVWSPNINIFRDPRWGRGQETYGEDPYLTSELGKSFVLGLQGNKPELKTAACVKHFAAHSGPESERHHFNSKVSKKDLVETYLPAFKACIQQANVSSVMGAYSQLNGEPCCGHSSIQELLRKQWKFNGLFISDCWAIRDFHEQHHITKTPEESAAMALNAGCDLNCGCTYNYLEKAYEKKLITKDAIKNACINVFTTRFSLDMENKTNPYNKIPFTKVDCKEHQKFNLHVARNSIVLLENEGILPLKKQGTLAIIGPNADSRQSLWGNYHGTASHYTTILEGIKNLSTSKMRIFYSEGTKLTCDKVERLAAPKDRIQEAIIITEQSDVAILCLGLDESIEGEMHDDGNGGIAGDKKNLYLPKCQQELLEAVASTGKPIIVVVTAGSAIDIQKDKYPSIKAVIHAFYPGAEGGKAIAEILFGKENPSAKLPITFYSGKTELPAFSDYSMNNRTYRYFTGEPLYPFGYGLSYTHYNYQDLKIIETKKTYKVYVTIKNEGGYDGLEISFVFAQNENADAPKKPFLVGFKKTYIKVGESKKIVFSIEKASLMLVNNDGEIYKPKEPFSIIVGGSQNQTNFLSKMQTNCITQQL